MIRALPPSDSSGLAPQINSSNQAATAVDNNLITSDPAAFAKRLKEIDNENEVLIALKKATTPGMAKSTLEQLPTGGNNVIALPKASATTSTRTLPGFAKVNTQSREAIQNVLSSGKATNIRAADYANIITATLPAKETKKVIAALLNNPHVDYIEANQRIPVQFDDEPAINLLYPLNNPMAFTGPVGSNPADIKHHFHFLLDAWDYTRGSGARIGILDSGFSYDQGTNSYHPDGQLISSTQGIEKLGFVDDFDDYGNCNGGGSGQPYGNCIGWDDHGHGTSMAGLTGANDNNIGNVGVMPEGLTISMKIAQNCYITQGCPDDDTDYYIESDDFYWAVEWARNNNVDALSMSFSTTTYSLSVYYSLSDAYHTDNIVLLSSTGNPGDAKQLDHPQSFDFVIGVGGLNSNGTNYGKDEFEDISALSDGRTTDAFCPGDYQFCEPSGYRYSGGTSASTAIAAGIVGLIRAHNPSLSASQVRQRLINTSEGIHNQLNAYVAVTNDYPLSVYINGPGYIGSSGNYSWEAMPQDGDTGYNYQWEYRIVGGNWTQVSTSKTYSRSVFTGSPNFQLRVTVTSGPEQESALKYVTVASQDCPPDQICPQTN